MARQLILIKHAAPLVTPGQPSERWPLSPEGRERCADLADAVRAFAPAVVVSSVEPKAAETGKLIADRLGIPSETGAGLHEHDRSNVPHMPTREFIGMMELVFRKPAERVLGRESAADALERFRTAVTAACERHPTGNVAVVSHGTVIALLLAEWGAGKGFELWRRMGLPSFAVVEAGQWRVAQLTERL
jgi:broad specificity phosphatase PhoE